MKILRMRRKTTLACDDCECRSSLKNDPQLVKCSSILHVCSQIE